MRQYRVTILIDSYRYSNVVVSLDPFTYFTNGVAKGGANKADTIYAVIGALLNPLYPSPLALKNRLLLRGGMVYQCGKSVPMCLCSVVGDPIELQAMDAFSAVENFESGVL